MEPPFPVHPPKMSLRTRPLLLLRIEAAALVTACAYAFGRTGVSWILFAALLLAPDLAFAAYLRGPRVGAAVYNLAHLGALPAAMGVVGVATQQATVIALALIWLAHLGIDRLLGFGLKSPTALSDTHVGRN
ncbi:MAG: DUF4260 family protein [Actinobacteria bacterium]|nr:DUF4260 family protein [Actinomycetota bacterium]